MESISSIVPKAACIKRKRNTINISIFPHFCFDAAYLSLRLTTPNKQDFPRYNSLKDDRAEYNIGYYIVYDTQS